MGQGRKEFFQRRLFGSACQREKLLVGTGTRDIFLHSRIGRRGVETLMSGTRDGRFTSE